MISTKHLPWPQDDQSWQASDFQTPTPNPHTARTHTHTPSYYTRVLVPTLSARASELIQLQPKQLWAVFPYPCGFLCWILPAELNGYFNHWYFDKGSKFLALIQKTQVCKNCDLRSNVKLMPWKGAIESWLTRDHVQLILTLVWRRLISLQGAFGAHTNIPLLYKELAPGAKTPNWGRTEARTELLDTFSLTKEHCATLWWSLSDLLLSRKVVNQEGTTIVMIGGTSVKDFIMRMMQ